MTEHRGCTEKKEQRERKLLTEHDGKFHTKDECDVNSLRLNYDHIADKSVRMEEINNEIFNDLSANLFTTNDHLASEVKNTIYTFITCETCLNSIMSIPATDLPRQAVI